MSAFETELATYRRSGAETLRPELETMVTRAMSDGATAKYMYFVSDVLIDLREYQRAIDVLTWLDGRYGLGDIGLNMLAFCHWESGREDDAYRAYQRSLALNPDNVSSLRGACFLAIEHSRTDDALEHCARFYQKGGETQEAAVWYATALRNAGKVNELAAFINNKATRFGDDSELSEFLQDE